MTDTTDHGPDNPDGPDGHAPFLAHHFDTPEQQFASGKLGMWLFLLTEILLFGGLFCAYAVFRATHPEIFVWAHEYLDKTLGAVNTCVLITSSLTMAWGVHCAQRGQRRGVIVCLVLTLLLACGFMGIKGVEYEHKWKEGLLWAELFSPVEHAADGETAHEEAAGAPSAAGADQPRDAGIFFSVYFLMTGLHGLHVLAGMAAISWVLVRTLKGHFSAEYFYPVDYVGLYWHLVDLIWIFLFPLFYLIH